MTDSTPASAARWPCPTYASDGVVTLIVDLNMTRGPDVIWGGESDQATTPVWVPLTLGQSVRLLDEDGCLTPAVIVKLEHPPFGDGVVRHYEARADWSKKSGYVEVSEVRYGT